MGVRVMTGRYIDICFRAEGTDDGIPSLHTYFQTTLERGWKRPFLKGNPLADGTPSPFHLTSIVIAQDLEDDHTWDRAAAVMDAWLARHGDFVRSLDCQVRTIHVQTYLLPDECETVFYFYPATASAAGQAGCGLQVWTVRVLPFPPEGQPGGSPSASCS